MYQRAAIGKYNTILRSAAESGLDYTISQLNTSITNGKVTSALADGAWHAVPPAAVGNNGATVTVKVVQRDPPPTSAIYMACTVAPTVNPSAWYVATASASYAGMAKKIRVVLQPNCPINNGTTTATNTTTTTTTIPYFKYAVFGQKSISLSGNAHTDGYNAQTGVYDPIGGNVGTNALPAPAGAAAGLSGNASIGGSLYVLSGGTSTLASGSGNAAIQNQLIDGGNAAGPNYNTSGFNSSNVHDLGASYNPPRTLSGAASDPRIINSTNLPSSVSSGTLLPQSLAAPQGIPAGATVVNPTIHTQGNGGNAVYTVQQPAANTVVNLGALSQAGNVQWKLPPGDYEVSTLSTSGNGQIQLIAGNNGQYGQVRLFVQGSSSSNAVQISGNGVVNASNQPGNFQIWYGGSQNIQLSGNGSLYGVVYAPQSNVSISGNGSIYGAVVGYTITDSGNGTVRYDESLSNNTNLSYTTTSTNTTTTTTTSLQAGPLTSLQAITWQEPRSWQEEQAW